MYEHLLNLDSVFCPILSFGLADMLFRIELSNEVCVCVFGRHFRGRPFDIQHHGMDVHRFSRLVRWRERFFGRYQ